MQTYLEIFRKQLFPSSTKGFSGAVPGLFSFALDGSIRFHRGQMYKSHPLPHPHWQRTLQKSPEREGLTVMGQEGVSLFQKALLVISLSW